CRPTATALSGSLCWSLRTTTATRTATRTGERYRADQLPGGHHDCTEPSHRRPRRDQDLESLPMETLIDYARRALHKGIYGVLSPAVSLATTRLGEEFPIGMDLADWIDPLEDTYNSDMEEGFATLNGTL